MKSKMLILVYLSVFLLMVFHMPAIAETLFSEDFSSGADRWEEGSGTWAIKNGEYVQETEDFFTASFLKKEFWDPTWTEYTLELKAMRLKGAEAWDIVFGIQQDNVPVVKGDRQTFFDWNIGGWTNTKSGVRKWTNGSNQVVLETPHTIEVDKWYKIKIEVSPTKVVGYLDGEQVFEHNEGPPEGRIGFEMFGTSAAYDDIIVYDADGPQAVHPDGKLAAFWGSIKLRK